MAQRKRIGLAVPSSDITCEADFMMAAPPGVTIHSHRLWLPVEGAGKGSADLMCSQVPEAAKYLATAKVDAIAFGCTTASFYNGPEAAADLVRAMEEATGAPAAVTSQSAVEALRFFGAKKVSIVTPYKEWANRRLIEYMTDAGFEVLNLEADPWAFEESGRMIGEREPEDILEFASAACRPEADALFCSCTAWRSMEVAEELEKRTGKPVVTSNQAMIWVLLRRLGFTEPIRGFGRLLESLAPAAAPA